MQLPSNPTKMAQKIKLMLPSEEEDSNGVSFFNFEENKVYTINNEDEFDPENYDEIQYVGSSHGWLISLDKEKAGLCLLHHSTEARIYPPCFESFPGVTRVTKTPDGRLFICSTSENHQFDRVTIESFIRKAILTCSPTHSRYGVVVIYGGNSNLAFCTFPHHNWIELEGNHPPYVDVICNKNRVYALSAEGYVEAWDMNRASPLKIKEVEPYFPRKRKVDDEDGFNLRKKCIQRFYLVNYKHDDLLLVIRYIGEFVTSDNKVVEEIDLLGDKDNPHLICPYKTMVFDVFKLDNDKMKWVEVGSLGEFALFVGGNHSLSISAKNSATKFEGNSIFFTDDYLDRVNEDYLYGGHDVGVFRLEDKSIEQFIQFDSDSIQIKPPPLWIIN